MTNRQSVLDLVRPSGVRKLSDRLWGTAAAFVRRRWGRDRPSRALTLLAPPEKALLRRFLLENTTTLRVPAAGVAIGLELADIVSISREPGQGSTDAFVLGINPWAWEHLRRHPELVGTGRRDAA